MYVHIDCLQVLSKGEEDAFVLEFVAQNHLNFGMREFSKKRFLHFFLLALRQ